MPLLLPLIVSWTFDMFAQWLDWSGSWNLMIGFIYKPVALIAHLWAFGRLIRSSSLFYVIYGASAVALAVGIWYVYAIHGVEYVNVNDSPIMSGLMTPLLIAIGVAIELNRIISPEREMPNGVLWLSRAWMLYFISSYMHVCGRYFTFYLGPETKDMMRSIIGVSHTLGYIMMLVVSLIIVHKFNLKEEWSRARI